MPRLSSLAYKPIQIGAKAISSVALPPVISAIRGGAVDFDRSIVWLDAIGAYPVVAAIVSLFAMILYLTISSIFICKPLTPIFNAFLFTQLMAVMLDRK